MNLKLICIKSRCGADLIQCRGAVILYLLNLLDLLCTLIALAGGGVELNPLMGCVPVMVVYKAGVVGVLCLVLGQLSHYPTARWAVGLGSAVYAAVDFWHLIHLIQII